jgi:hypothetical protein
MLPDGCVFANAACEITCSSAPAPSPQSSRELPASRLVSSPLAALLLVHVASTTSRLGPRDLRRGVR